MDKSLASLEVLFWLMPKGIKEKDLLELLEMDKREDLIKTLEEVGNSWKEDSSKGFLLKNERSLWYLEPKEPYLFWQGKVGKTKKIPLDQREVIALLFYEEGLSLKQIEEKRSKKNSQIILSHLLKEELVDKKGESFFLSDKCRNLFLDADNKTRMDK